METQNNELHNLVEPDSDLKNMLVEYVGESLDPDDQNVTVEMIVDVVAKEFPEFLLAIAEENWVRGYQQALQDADEGEKIYQKMLQENEQSSWEHQRKGI